MKKEVIKFENANKTQKYAFNLAKDLKGGDVLCLYGNLGSGKTTFTQGLAKGLGIKRRIISPTFIIIRKYQINNLNFYHIDLYRTGSLEDLIGLGIPEILEDKENIIVVEWAEKLSDLVPFKRTDIFFNYIDDTTRSVEINKYE